MKKVLASKKRKRDEGLFLLFLFLSDSSLLSFPAVRDLYAKGVFVLLPSSESQELLFSWESISRTAFVYLKYTPDFGDRDIKSGKFFLFSFNFFQK
jgi:hypothetical protein